MRLRRNTQVGATLLLFFLVTVGLLGDGCSEAPTEPGDDPPKNYRVWCRAQAEDHKLFSYHTTTGEFEAHSIPWQIASDITVSHDGRLLYVPALVESELVVKILETDSLRTVGEIPYFLRRRVVVSPEGRYVALLGDSLLILRTVDYTIVYADTLPSWDGAFSFDGEILYLAYGFAPVVRVSLSNLDQIVVDQLPKTDGVRQVIPTPDDAKLLLYGMVGTYVWLFSVYDIELDSIIFTDVQIPGYGQVAMTPDGRYAFYGNPGTLFGQPGLGEFTVFDIEANTIRRRVSTTDYEKYESPFPALIGELVVTPDSRWLLAASGQMRYGRGLFKYDISNEALVDYSDFGRLTMSHTIQSIH